MPKNSNSNWSEYFSEPNPGLLTYFDRVRKGNDQEYRTTFYKGSSLAKVLSGWKPTLDTIESKWPGLVKYENDLAEKVGPLSIQLPLERRMSDIDSYYDSIHLESKPLSSSALAAVKREWNVVGKLQLNGQRLTVDNMRKSTNSGNPYFTRRRSVINKTIPASLDIQQPDIVQYLVDQRWKSCAVLGWRGQEGGPTDDDVKQRVVWMFPFGINVAELQFYQVGIKMAQRFDLVPAWVGMDAVDRRITKLFDTKGRKDLIVCTDFTKFDQHFNSDMQAAAKHIIQSMLADTAENRVWLNETFPVKYMIPLAYDYGKIRYGDHGMGSGSGGTNFDETLAHRALQYEAAQAENQKLNPNSQCLGDDGILSYPGITADSVMQSYTSHGQDMNLEKQSESTHECTYLRRWHHTDYRVNGVCVGVYSTYRALGRLCEQERYYDPSVWGSRMVALRQLSIINNCEYHPLREKFVQYCMKGDKYRLGIDIPGFLDNIESIAKDATDLMPDFLGYTKTLGRENDPSRGIADWWIVKYLKSM